MISTDGKATSSRIRPMRAYTPVFFAFLIFSSSPYDVVYWIPEKTTAPTAKSAQKAITRSEILITSSLTHSTEEPIESGLTD